VQDLLGDRMGKDVFFYSITLQPELDSVKRLKEYAEDVVEAGPGWLFLTGEEDDLDQLRRAQGFVDPDPERDRDVNNHASMGRIICDQRELWGTTNLLTSPRNIKSAFSVFL
jgi:protein SCO1